MREYICTIDQSVFNTEEQLVKHLIKMYSIEQVKGENKSKILNVLSENFPTADIEIILEDGVPLVNMVVPGYGENYFHFKISEKNDGNIYGVTTYLTVEEAITHYKLFFAHADELVKEIEKKFNAHTISIEQLIEFNESMGADDRNTCLLNFCIEQETHHFHYEFEGIDKAIRTLEGRFITTVEGEVFTDYGSYNSNNTVYIDGVDIVDLAKRAKRMKVEILELKKYE
jgi:hypothetical protein